MREIGRTHLTCPECGHNDCFTEFVDSDGSEGYCFSCGNTILKSNVNSLSMPQRNKKPQANRIQLKPDKSLSFEEIGDTIHFLSIENYEFGERSGILMDSGISVKDADRMAADELGLSRHDICRSEAEAIRKQGNYFGAWLIQMTGDHDVLRRFNVGYSNNRTIFWYVDYQSKIVNGKLIKYLPDGHRDKASHPRLLYKQADGYGTCLFNEEELAYRRGDSVVLVESEKSAILCSYYMPEVIWIATGGTNGLTKGKARVLRDRSVYVLFDADKGGENGSVRARQTLLEAGAFPSIIAPSELYGESIPQGYNIGDYIVERRIKYAG